MEPTLAVEHGDLHELRLDLLRRAVEIYLELAYSSGVVPEVVRRRLKWREDCAADELLSGPPFECAGKAPGRQTSIYALRLGNAPLSAHEAPDPALAQRCRLHAFGQYSRSGRGDQPQRRGRASVPGSPGRKPAPQGGRSSRRGTRLACPHSSAISAITSRAEGTIAPPLVETTGLEATPMQPHRRKHMSEMNSRRHRLPVEGDHESAHERRGAGRSRGGDLGRPLKLPVQPGRWTGRQSLSNSRGTGSFVKTEEYRKIRQLVTDAVAQHGLVEGGTPKKSGRVVAENAIPA